MRAQTVNEESKFERGLDPKLAMGIGLSEQEKVIARYFSGEKITYEDLLKLEGIKTKGLSFMDSKFNSGPTYLAPQINVWVRDLRKAIEKVAELRSLRKDFINRKIVEGVFKDEKDGLEFFKRTPGFTKKLQKKYGEEVANNLIAEAGNLRTKWHKATGDMQDIGGYLISDMKNTDFAKKWIAEHGDKRS